MLETDRRTGYPSVDKPWLNYYTEEQIHKEIPNVSLRQYIYKENKDYLKNVAIDYYGKKVTYEQLFDEIDTVSSAFYGYGIRENDTIATCLLTVPETIYMVYGLEQIGARVDMIDPRNSIEWIQHFIDEDRAKLIITLDVLASKIIEAIGDRNIPLITISPSDSLPILLKVFSKKVKLANGIITWKSFIKKYTNDEKTFEIPAFDKKRCCVIEHTGGTTGMPKSVMLSSYNFNAVATQCVYSPLNLDRGDKLMNIMPPFIAYGMTLGIHVALAAGWVSVLIPKFDANHFDDLLLKYKPQGVMGVPTYYESLMDSKKIAGKDLSFIKCLLVGGDKIKVEFEKQVNIFLKEHNCNFEISKGYSMTEAGSAATFSFENCNVIGSCGIPLPKTIISVFDENGDELTYNNTGNIRIHTPSTMIGYLNNDKETNNLIVEDRDGKKWICTGDIGYIDECGRIFIEGRSKRLIIRFDGFKIFPFYIENSIMKHQLVKECCVVGHPDEHHVQGMLPVAFVTMKEQADEDIVIKELYDLCKNELPEYEQPFKIVRIESMPVTAIGKIDYRKLEEMESTRRN